MIADLFQVPKTTWEIYERFERSQKCPSITVVHVIAVMHGIADPPKNLTTTISRRYLDGAATKSKNDFKKRVEQNSLTIEFLLHPDIIWEKSEIRRRW
jgi:hypothetical protein